MMVTNCQGAYNAARNTFALTDPVVYCASRHASYGDQSEGDKGFQRFFQTHCCNTVCWSLKLPTV